MYILHIPYPPSAPWPPKPLSSDEEAEYCGIVLDDIHRPNEEFNVIRIDKNNNAIYELNMSIGKALRNLPIVSSSYFPICLVDEIMKKRYLQGALDICEWNGMKCVYKQIEFDPMIEPMKREVEAQESLLNYFYDSDNRRLSELGICPILSVVIDENQLFRGVILPLAGVSLD